MPVEIAIAGFTKEQWQKAGGSEFAIYSNLIRQLNKLGYSFEIFVRDSEVKQGLVQIVVRDNKQEDGPQRPS